MKDLKQILQNECHGRDLDERKHWYSPAAIDYQQVRPRYPQVLIDRVVEIAQLSSDSNVLEVGCGPAIATTAFASLGCHMVCVEPNPDFCHLAQNVCECYPNVEVQNCLFEEWELATNQFDAVLAASSLHWIPPEIAYPKAAAALKPEGVLIALWNKELQPCYEVYQQLTDICQTHAPDLKHPYEESVAQVAILNQLGHMMIESGQFKDMVAGHVEVEVTYSVDQYLRLLNTYSSFLRLEPQRKQRLFARFRQVLDQNGPMIELVYVSAFHIARPK